MSTEEEEWTLARDRQRDADREARAEHEASHEHSCYVDLCNWDDNGDCVLNPCYEPFDDEEDGEGDEP